MKHVTVYSTPTCAYCMKAKQLLTSLNVAYEEVDLASNDTLREELSNKYNWQTVPMIVIGDEFIGGADDLARHHANGMLMEKLA